MEMTKRRRKYDPSNRAASLANLRRETAEDTKGKNSTVLFPTFKIEADVREYWKARLEVLGQKHSVTSRAVIQYFCSLRIEEAETLLKNYLEGKYDNLPEDE